MTPCAMPTKEHLRLPHEAGCYERQSQQALYRPEKVLVFL